jgi:hypothetical protein
MALARPLPPTFSKHVLSGLRPLELIMVALTYKNGFEEVANRLADGNEDEGFEAILVRIRELAKSNPHLNHLTAAELEAARR